MRHCQILHCLDLPHGRSTCATSLVERGVPDGEHGVPQTNGVSHYTLVRFLVQVRFSTLGIDMRMRTEERHEGTRLVPSDQHFGAGIAKKAPDIGCARGLVRRCIGFCRIPDLPPQNVMPQILSESNMDVSPAM